MKHFKAQGGQVIALYSSIKEMPARRYNEFQRHLLLEAGIGSDMDAITKHLGKWHNLFTRDMKAEALVEAENLHYCFHSILNKIDFRSLAFACLVAKIDDEVCNDLEEEGLERTAKLLLDLDLTIEDLERETDAFKKKIADELSLQFPSIFSPEEDYEFYSRIKQQIALTASLALEEGDPDEIKAKLAAIEDYIVKQNRPNNFRPDDAENVIVALDRNFGILCSQIDKNGTSNSQELSLFDFYSRIDFISKMNGPRKVA